MKRGCLLATLLAVALAAPVPSVVLAQTGPLKNATEFSSIDYFDPPYQLQMSSRFTGAEAKPVSENVMFVRQMKLETFDTNGVPKYIIEAPECLYDREKDTANSAGRIKIRRADGHLVLTGEGFSWVHDTNAGSLYISNEVHTVIAAMPELKLKP